jgi:hypothetical protein
MQTPEAHQDNFQERAELEQDANVPPDKREIHADFAEQTLQAIQEPKEKRTC